ncbi:MAG: Ig-like domain-containing protein [Verrucomicrobiae bacterium]|nr:Ig-like domain-containing protein [Verrucomicrobiae bacterium]
MRTRVSALGRVAVIPVLTVVLGLVPAPANRVEAQTNHIVEPTVVTVCATDPVARETGPLTYVDPGIFTLRRAGPTNIALTVWYAVSGTASNGVDYIRLPGSAVIPPGSTEVEIPVYPLADGQAEGTETVVLRLVPPVCITIYPPPPECYVVGAPGEATVYIFDFDQSNQPPSVRITEPAPGDTFIAPTNILIRAVAVDSDGWVTNIAFYANARLLGQAAPRTTLPAPGRPAEAELIWTNAMPGQYVLTAVATDNLGAAGTSAPVRISVSMVELPTNSVPVVSIIAIDPVAAEGTNCFGWPRFMPCLSVDSHGPRWVTNAIPPNTATFVVRRSGSTNSTLTVFYRVSGTASNGVDYVRLPGSVTIPAGRRAAHVVVVPVDDELHEPLESVVVELIPSLIEVYPPPYRVGRPARAAAVIVDNDAPRPPVAVLPDRCFHACWPATNGQWFTIEYSTNLVDWTPVVTNIVGEGALHFVDPDGATGRAGFYRAVPMPAPADTNILLE